MKYFYLLLFLMFSTSTINAQLNILVEGFEEWPLEGWTNYETNLANSWGPCWQNDCGYIGNFAANHYLCNGCEKWLITPQLYIVNSDVELSFWERFDQASTEFYDYSAIMISTGSPDPLDGDFVELFTNNPDNLPFDWVERTVDLSAYVGQNIYLALLFSGNWHEWFVDELTFAPAIYADGAVNEVISPAGTNPDPSIEEVIINVSNNGNKPITEYTVQWDVNGVMQPPFMVTGVNILPGANINIPLGFYDFNASGDYLITGTLIIANEFNQQNNHFESIYFVSTEKDATISNITPNGYTPIVGLTEVKAVISNMGENVITTAEIVWEVDGIDQAPVQISSLFIPPGSSKKVPLGQYNFDEGIHEIYANVNVSGEINPDNDGLTSYLAVNTFWESFEGPTPVPESWYANWLMVDNFVEAPHGGFYALFNNDDNFFGEIIDTLFTPVLMVESGDQLSFHRRFSTFFPGNMKVVWQDFETEEVIDIETITSNANGFQQFTVDLAPATGIGRIGFITWSSGPSDQSLDLVTSDAQPHLFEVDLLVKDFQTNYLAKQEIPQAINFTLKNIGNNFLFGDSYTIKLMDTNGTEIEEIPGVDINIWEEIDLQFAPVFNDIMEYNLYVEVVINNDGNPSNNSTRPERINVVPADIELIDIGEAEYRELNFPFNFSGDDWNASKDDLSQCLFYKEEISTSGYIYGITYYYKNFASNYQDFPLKVWVAPTDAEDLADGWDLTSDFTLVLDDTLEIKGGEMNPLYIPFDTPILYTNINNLVIQHYAYECGWPPAIGSTWAQQVPNGPVRVVRLVDNLEADPDNIPFFYGVGTSVSKTTFVVQPLNQNTIVSGTCFDENNLEVSNAMIEVTGQLINESSDELGNYTLPDLSYTTYEIVASLYGYNDNVQTVTLDEPFVELDFYMELRPQIQITGDIVGSNDLNTALQTVDINAIGYDDYNHTTGSTGEIVIDNVYGNDFYTITFSKYGYYDKTIEVDILDVNIDLGTIVLDQEFISPYSVYANPLLDNSVNVEWYDPVTSEKVKFQNDMNFTYFSYTNDINENVWLGNKFTNNEEVTLQNVEIYWDIYLLNSDYVTVDVFDENEEVIASSQAFVTLLDTLVTVEMPNVTVDGDFYVMVHWQDNQVNTHALRIDYSPGIGNTAYIKYPDQPMQLLTDFLGNEPGAFLVRANVLKEGPNSGNSPLSYNIYSGSPDDMSNVAMWPQLNSSPINALSYVDFPLESGELIYAVEAVYEEGNSEHSFSNVLDYSIVEVASGIPFEAKVLLEGPYQSNGLMSTSLTDFIPFEQPYNVPPYNYEGTETLFNVPQNAVDWVLVEIRDGSPSLTAQTTTVLETKAGLLLDSGFIVNTDGVSPLTFEEVTEGDSYHICIRHRNHLDILSSEAILADELIEYDFTLDSGKAFGSEQTKPLGDGFYGMHSGDYTKEGVIQTTDYNLWFNLPASVNVYSNADGTLDGVVQVTDYDKWFINKAKIGTPEVRFD